MKAGHGHYGATANVRYSDGVWQMRCPECAAKQGAACWWDLSTEFWDPRTLQRCRSCDRIRRRRSDARRAAARKAYNRQYRKDNAEWLGMKRQQRHQNARAAATATRPSAPA